MRRILLRFENVVTESQRVKGLNKLSFLLASEEMLGILTVNQHGMNDLTDILENNKKIKEGKLFFEEKLVSSYENTEITIINRYPRLLEGLTIAENVFILKSPPKIKMAKKETIIHQTNHLLSKYGINCDASDDVSILNSFERCLLQMIKALISGCKIIILEDVGKMLNLSNFEKLLQVIKEFKKQGIGFIYINNFPDEFLKRCDRVMIYESGKIIKNFYEKRELEEVQSFFKKNMLRREFLSEKAVSINLMSTGLPLKFSFPNKLYQGGCLTVLDRYNEKLKDVLSMFYYGKKVTEIEAIEILEDKTIFFIPENAIEHSLFKDCSYLFNLSFYLDKKLKKNLIPEKFYSSIKKEFKESLGEKMELDSLRSLNNYDLIELVYHRAILQKPDVVLIYQPFFDCDMQLQPYIDNLILSLKKNNISVLILTSYIANLESLSEGIIEL